MDSVLVSKKIVPRVFFFLAFFPLLLLRLRVPSSLSPKGPKDQFHGTTKHGVGKLGFTVIYEVCRSGVIESCRYRKGQHQVAMAIVPQP